MKTKKNLHLADTVKTSRELREKGGMPVEQADAVSVAVHSTVADAVASVNDNIDELRKENKDALKDAVQGLSDRIDKSVEESRREHKELGAKIDKSNEKADRMFRWTVGLLVAGLSGIVATLAGVVVTVVIKVF